MNLPAFFTWDEGSLFLKLLLAHLLSDFVFQSRYIAEKKNFRSAAMLLHIAITYAAVFVLTLDWKVALWISIPHYLVDSLKVSLQKKMPGKNFRLFLLDQLAHVLVLFLVWSASLGKSGELIQEVQGLFNNYKILLITTGYLLCIWPASFAVRFATQDLMKGQEEATSKIQNGGRWIGQFERIIILTLVLLSHYEAIGFLITGKSIIRFADRDHLKSEYVLAGTMLSYAIAITVGAFINYILGLPA